MKFELEGEVRACCLAKPLTYADLLKSIRDLFGSQTVANLESIRVAFSRDDAPRLPITNDDDLQKIVQIAEANGSSKLNLILTRKKLSLNERTRVGQTNDEGDRTSEDGRLEDERIDSPPPGTIVQHKRRPITTTTPVNKSSRPNDGGFFIPESVSLIDCQVFDESVQLMFFLDRRDVFQWKFFSDQS